MGYIYIFKFIIELNTQAEDRGEQRPPRLHWPGRSSLLVQSLPLPPLPHTQGHQTVTTQEDKEDDMMDGGGGDVAASGAEKRLSEGLKLEATQPMQRPCSRKELESM